MTTVHGTRHRSKAVRQQREVHKQSETRKTTSARTRIEQPKDSMLRDAAEGFALGAIVGWELPYLKSKVALGDRMTELLGPALLLAQAGSAVGIGALFTAARLVKRHSEE